MATFGVHEESEHFVRALSHDMSATFMLLEDSFARLKRSLDDPARPSREQSIAHVDACLRELKRYLDDLSGLAKTGRVALEPSVVDSSAVLDEVLFEQRDAIETRGVQMLVQRPLPPVWCNPHRLKEVFTNLLRNALLHGCDRSEPAVAISAEPAMGRGDVRQTAIRIYDNGRGIEPRYHEEIFLPGRRLPGGSSEGSGMGLAIVRKAIEYYGGQVYVDARCQTGTAIVLCLPTPADTQMPNRLRRNSPSSTVQADRKLGADAAHQQGDMHAHQLLQPLTPPVPRG